MSRPTCHFLGAILQIIFQQEIFTGMFARLPWPNYGLGHVGPLGFEFATLLLKYAQIMTVSFNSVSGIIPMQAIQQNPYLDFPVCRDTCLLLCTGFNIRVVAILVQMLWLL